jgi:hypothetical protein
MNRLEKRVDALEQAGVGNAAPTRYGYSAMADLCRERHEEPHENCNTMRQCIYCDFGGNQTPPPFIPYSPDRAPEIMAELMRHKEEEGE